MCNYQEQHKYHDLSKHLQKGMEFQSTSTFFFKEKKSEKLKASKISKEAYQSRWLNLTSCTSKACFALTLVVANARSMPRTNCWICGWDVKTRDVLWLRDLRSSLALITSEWITTNTLILSCAISMTIANVGICSDHSKTLNFRWSWWSNLLSTSFPCSLVNFKLKNKMKILNFKFFVRKNCLKIWTSGWILLSMYHFVHFHQQKRELALGLELEHPYHKLHWFWWLLWGLRLLFFSIQKNSEKIVIISKNWRNSNAEGQMLALGRPLYTTKWYFHLELVPFSHLNKFWNFSGKKIFQSESIKRIKNKYKNLTWQVSRGKVDASAICNLFDCLVLSFTIAIDSHTFANLNRVSCLTVRTLNLERRVLRQSCEIVYQILTLVNTRSNHLRFR